MSVLDKIIADALKLDSSGKPNKSKDQSEQKKQNHQSSKSINKLLKALTQSKSVSGSKKGFSQLNGNCVRGSNFKAPEFNQRVIIKATYKIIANRVEARKSLKSHMGYIMREGTGNSPPFSPDQLKMEENTIQAFTNDENEKTFRFIISPENAKLFKSDDDYKSYIQDVMIQMSKDIQIPELNWMAVNHYNTDNPHTHVLLKGLSKNGQDVRIPKEYLKDNFRKMAEEIATNYLGTRSIEDLNAAKHAEVDAERFTSIDAKILLCAKDNIYTIESSTKIASKIRNDTSRLITQRLQTLTRMGLVKPFGKNNFAIHPEIKERLQSMPLEKDIIKRLAVLSKNYVIDKNIHYGQENNNEPITGIVIDKGYYDEANESKYIIVLGMDRKSHYVKLSKFSEISGNESNIGNMVSVSSKTTTSLTNQKEYQSIVLNKISNLTIHEQINYNGITYLDRVIANKTYLIDNPNNYQKELIEAVELRSQYLMSLGKLFKINDEFKFKKGYWLDSEVSEHSGVSSDFQQNYKSLQEGESFTGKMIDTKIFQDGTYAIVSNGKEFIAIPLKPKMLDHLNSGHKLEITKSKERRGYSTALYIIKPVQDLKIAKEKTESLKN